MTNPDMLHAGILPHHAHWARTLQKLRYVVVDELHTYRGVFGSHVAHVIARLRRAARFHGSDPVFLSATATIGNPREHAAKLFGVPEDEIALVDESGAPRGPRRLFVFNPPVVNAELGVRASALKSAVMLASDLVRAKVPTLVFGQSRNAVEIMLKYLRDRLAPEMPGVEDAIMRLPRRLPPRGAPPRGAGPQGGPDPLRGRHQRARAGHRRRRPRTRSACAGYPGSIAGAWQRFGRAGPAAAQSIAVMIASSAPLDQYLAGHPDYLLQSGVEAARIDPSNTEIVIQHLKCAAFELPFLRGEPHAVMEAADTGAALDYLAGHGVVHASGDRYHWSADAYPANHVSLRTVGWDNFVIIDKSTGSAIAELDFRATHTMLHEQAIYQHDGEQYQVEKRDYENHKAFVTKVVPDYSHYGAGAIAG